ncbi:winged helix DNA-binding domain-containing protein [Labilibaculum sp. DW002]|uniref:Winged helix DNA-binding domain-containing protein n=1 Tax=Paralabilibaculum antarcticum TaxID=2912572 RepID=A0ABT5VU97_9BACT|nr:crosslink repair DNA glycosylase YcaQ family protein [Labilibaculum sp. DW002]MDE5418990.1 winged helix DNA-binding domain-containing protein [Labilibaculum sp. DW002]
MAKITESLSIQQARKLVLLSQKIPPAKASGTALSASLSAIEHLGYIQIDTISAIERAHHHTLWNRNPLYQNTHLDQLVADKKVFEYWSHAAAYLPMRDYRFSLPRKRAIANGDAKHWFKRDAKLMNSVLKRIADEGPLMAKDFDQTGKKKGEWTTKPAKQALENLFMQGDVMIGSRLNFHKVYELTERVLPDDINTNIPNEEEHLRFLINRYLEANGLGQASEIAYLLKNTKIPVQGMLQEMHLSGELMQIIVGENKYYTLANSLELLNKPLARNKLNILSPFDNLVIQRKRLKTLFNFDYQIECYVPEAKRQYGYFSLPILWNGKFVARMDCKAERKNNILHINHIALEDKLTKTEDFAYSLVKELQSFMKFNNCNKVQLYKTTPSNFTPILNDLINNMAT